MSTPSLPLARTADALVLGRGRLAFLVAMLVLTIVCGRYALHLRAEQSNASMSSSRPAERAVEQRFLADFGNDEVIVVALTHPEILGPDGVAMVRNVTERIAALDGVRRTTSLTNVRQIVSGPEGAEPAPLLLDPLPPGEEGAAAVRRALDANPHLTGLLISADRRTAAILVELENRDGDDSYRARLVRDVRAIQQEARPAGAAIHVTGITLQKDDTTRLVRRDQSILLPLSLLMLAISLAVVTRHIAGVLLPLVVTGVTVVITLGLYAALGHQVNVITSLLPPLLLVLSTTTAIHLFQEWVALGPRVPDRAGRLRSVLRFFVAPCFMTSLTTAIGLGSLVVNDIPAVRLFGAFGAFGIMLSFVLNFTLMPALLSFLDPPAAPRRRVGVAFEGALKAAARFAVRRPGLTFLAAGVPTVLALIGLPMIRNNTDLVRFLREDEALVRDTRFIDRTLGGASAIDLVIERRDGRPLTGIDDVRRLDAFVDEVRRLSGVTGALALTDLLKQLHRAEHRLDRLALPEDGDRLAELFDLLDAAEDQSDIRRVMTPDVRRARVTLRLHSMGTREVASLLDRVEKAGRAALGSAYVVTPTGSFYKITVDSNRLVAGQVGSFGLALALVLLVIGLMLRSVKLLVAAVLPNVVPILWTMGLMGWLGIDLSTATTMVASVVLGIAVDDAIHYLTRFRSEYSGDLEGAVLRTTGITGRVLSITTVVLTLGFWVGTLSSFKPTVYFSLLSGVTMVTALACTMTLLPACLRVLHAEREVPR